MWVIHIRMNSAVGKPVWKVTCHSEKTTDLTSVGRETNISFAVSYVTLCLLACIMLKYGPYLEKCLLHRFVFKQTHIYCRITNFLGASDKCWNALNAFKPWHLYTFSIPCWWMPFLQWWRELLGLRGEYKNFLKWKSEQSIPCSHSLHCVVCQKGNNSAPRHGLWEITLQGTDMVIRLTSLIQQTLLLKSVSYDIFFNFTEGCECRIKWFRSSRFRNKKFVLISFTSCRTHLIVFECKYSGDTELQYFLLFIVSQFIVFQFMSQTKAQNSTITRTSYIIAVV